jgi:putative ABC transport system substrate-binding protein
VSSESALGRVAITLLLLLLGAGSAVAQPRAKVPVIGFITNGTEENYRRLLDEFRSGLRELGYEEGMSIIIHYRYGTGSNADLEESAEELVRLKCDVIVTGAVFPQVRRASPTVPIVFLGVTQPVRLGFVKSLRQPGGNTTGFAYTGVDLNAKRLQVFKEALPRATRFAALATSKHPLYPQMVTDLEAASRSLGVRLDMVDVGEPTVTAIEAGFERISKMKPDGLLVLQHNNFYRELKRIVDLAARYRIPAMYELWRYVEAGGLLAYMPDTLPQWRKAAAHVDRILKGTNAGDIPVEEPTKFQLLVNMKTAKILGVTFSPSFLAQVDQLFD